MRPDLVLCLAVVHHLALTNNVPLDEIVALLADFGAPLVVEFPHRDDVMATRLLARKRRGLFDAYDVGELGAGARAALRHRRRRCPAERHAHDLPLPARADGSAHCDGVQRDLVAVAADLVDGDVVAAVAVDVGEVPDERPASRRSGDVATDHAGEAAVDGDDAAPVARSPPVDRAGDRERHLAVVGRQVGELRPLVDRRREVAGSPDGELGDLAPDEIAVVADRGETDPVVAVRELLAAPCRRCRAPPSTSVDTRGSVVAALPSNSEWPSNSQSTSASSRSTIDGSTSIALGAVVADLAGRSGPVP